MLYSKIKSTFKSKLKAEPKSTLATCEHRDEASSEPCSDCKAEKSRVRKYRWKIVLGLVFPYSLQALDATMYGLSLPVFRRTRN